MHDARCTKARFVICPKHLYSICIRLFLLQAPVIVRNATLLIERMQVGPANSLAINTTQFGQFGFEASNDIRVGIQVEVLRRRHVYRHRLINLLAPCTNSREASPVVRPSGCPLHVAMGRTRGLGRSCVVANANEGPARHSRTRGHRWNGEHDVHHRVEVDEKENGRQGVGDECNGEEQNTVAEQEPPQVRPAWSDDLFRVSDTTFAFANLLTTHQANCGHD